MILCVATKYLPEKIGSSFPALLPRPRLLICPRRFFVVVLGCDCMKKNIYGIIDLKTGNFGDLCILDRDEEFRDGCLKLFRDTDVPDYVVRDLMAVCYGTISYDSDSLFPKIDQDFRMIISGADALSLKDVSLETSDVHFDDDDISPIPAEEVLI